MTQTLQDGHLVPAVQARDVKCKIDRNQIKIHLHGDFITDLADFAAFFVKGFLADAIEDAINKALSETIPAASNAIFAKTDGILPIPMVKNWAIDW